MQSSSLVLYHNNYTTYCCGLLGVENFRLDLEISIICINNFVEIIFIMILNIYFICFLIIILVLSYYSGIIPFEPEIVWVDKGHATSITETP